MLKARRLIAAALLMLTAYSVWLLGAPVPRIAYTADECLRSYDLSEQKRSEQERMRVLHAGRAIEKLTDMNVSIDQAFGFLARLLVNTDNLILVASDFGQVFLGIPPLKPSVSERNRAAIRARFAGYSLVYEVAVALDITRCDAQHLIPDVGATSQDEARRMIAEALKRLRAA